MHRALENPIWLLFAFVGLAVGGCSQTSSSSGGAANSARGGVQQTRGSAGASSIDACRLLTKNEIQQQLGMAVGDGKLQTTDSQASCDWNAGDEGGLTVKVEDFNPPVWNSFTSSGRAKPVSGLGDAAFSNVPLPGGLMIRQGKYEIDVGVVDFKRSNDRNVEAATALAALVLPRVSGSK